jgi:regulator of RNase E activity RraA
MDEHAAGGTVMDTVSMWAGVGGVTVHPGDAILADENGVLVLAPSDVAAVAERALEMQARELVLLERLTAGESLPDISGATAKVEAEHRRHARRPAVRS